ncbi:alpha/beta-hydrolase [Setomelanomma holmii]|uniref:Alpha/beta-hydrolase n=1 Tax=Setomelanomma holmii TaxID=210430 RepID=A0A9P4LJB7_9PLEO|nr:alpha/beta-hydrolase [Setomelanomma holmii]
MPNTKTIDVPHLGGISAAYQTSPDFSPSTKPTLLLVNSFTTSSELYRAAYTNTALTSVMNLISIELLGHGQTRVKDEKTHWTYWDTAIMNLQVLEKLGVQKFFVLGTSQGGWITVRMALLGPDRVQGIIPLGTSLDYESERTRKLGCWQAPDLLGKSIQEEFSSKTATPDFVPSKEYSNFLIDIGFGTNVAKDIRDYWVSEIEKNYRGDDGRRRIRMAAINLRDRDGLHSRAADVICPVLWLHGTDDAVYTVANAKEEIELFTGSSDAKLEVIKGGKHFLSASHPEEVFGAVISFVKKYGKIGRVGDMYV